MTQTARTFPELIQALQCQGFSLSDITRQPVRIGGVWRCEVRHG